jgi:hypothetical protein
VERISTSFIGFCQTAVTGFSHKHVDRSTKKPLIPLSSTCGFHRP